MRPILAALVSLLAGGTAAAAPVELVVRDGAGRPLAGAVVTLESQSHPAPRRPDAPLRMVQQNIAFQPHVLIVPVGASVAFPNRDRVRHHVYSFSKPKPFELKLYGQEEARTVTFDRPGLVAIGCNIHDQMSAFIMVVTTPFAAQTDADGRVRFADVPPGGATLGLWHPSIRGPNNQTAQAAPVPAAGLVRTVTVQTR